MLYARTISLTTLAMIAFAGNSLLCWQALKHTAVASGALAAGLGYATWYTVLPALKNTSAASVQLSVPVIAALGGIAFLGEPMTLRLILASVAILGGIALVIVQKR